MSGLHAFIVSYDISDPKRLHAVHKIVKGFGDGLHYSVFRCNLSHKSKVELIVALSEIIKHDEDRIMIIHLGPLDGDIDKRIEFLGVHHTMDYPSAIIL